MALNVQAKDTATNAVGLSDLNLKADNVPTYAALLSQDGTTADPVVVVAQNSLSGPIVWTRTNAGEYMGTLAGAFPVGKTICTPVVRINTGENLFITLDRQTDDTIMITTSLGEDGWLVNSPVQILVYP